MIVLHLLGPTREDISTVFRGKRSQRLSVKMTFAPSCVWPSDPRRVYQGIIGYGPPKWIRGKRFAVSEVGHSGATHRNDASRWGLRGNVM